MSDNKELWVKNNNFLKDDFFDIFDEYFNKNKDYFNPAQTYSEYINFPDSFYINKFDKNDLKNYHNDSTLKGLKAKKNIIKLLHKFNYNLKINNITLSPTLTSASLIVQRFLKEKGVNEIILETPFYYATIFQLESMNMKYKLIPTYIDNNFEWMLNDINSNSAIWITNPRISIGSSQKKDFLFNLCKQVKKQNTYLIIDEATELTIPSLTTNVEFQQFSNNIIRLRSLFKPLGINGPRISMIIHPENIEKELKKWTWIFQGGLDFYSINIVDTILKNENEYKEMFISTKKRALLLNKDIKKMIKFSNIKLIQYDDGYTAALAIKLSKNRLSYDDYMIKRKQLLIYLESIEVFPTLGASMYFAFDGKYEFIRINYLANKFEMISFISNLLIFCKIFSKT